MNHGSPDTYPGAIVQSFNTYVRNGQSREALGEAVNGAAPPTTEGPVSAVNEGVVARIQDLGMPTLLTDAECRVLATNRQAAALLHTTALPGAYLNTLAPTKEAAGELLSLWKERCSKGVGWSHECKLLGQVGAYIDLHLVVIPVYTSSSDGQVWLVVAQDLTETMFHARELEVYALDLSRLYQKNRQDLHRLEEAEHSREQFFSLVSHELKTPLTSLKAALEMLSTPEVVPPQAQDAWRLADTMKRSTARLERLMNDLLDVATAQSGGLELSIGAVDMCDVIRSVVNEMTPVAAEKGVILVGPANYRHGLVVSGDELRLQQVLLNLVSNGIKATPPKGTVHIKSGRTASQVQVMVTNPGELPESIRDSLFEPFRKSAAGGYRTGAGLGLTVVHALVKAHQGTIEAESRRKQVVFTVTLPLWGKAGES
ncbi:MAG: HAMP domain-containing histidine kinase [Chloroflexi bacterium]|nr:HAMP domain-containing histidine kinase [Chloroflexota bacterium]